MADNYVALKIKATDDAKPDLTDLRARLEALNGQVAEARAKVSTAEADAPLAALQAKLDAVSRRVASPRIDMAGASRAIAELTAVDAALHHTDEESGRAGEGAGRRFADGFISYVKPPMSKGSLIAGGVLSGLAALPALTAGIGAIAGTALAAKFLVGTKQAKGPLYGQFEDMMSGLKSVMTSAVAPMIGPLRSAFTQLGSFMHQIGGQIGEVFKAIAPMVQPLTYGLEGLVGGILPGLISMMRAALPAVRAVSLLLGTLGADLGGMFAAFAPAIKASADVLGMLGTLLNGLLPVIGKLAAALAASLAPVLLSFGDAIRALMPAILTVGKILGSLAGAILTSLSGALTAVAQVVQGIAPAFGVLAGVLNQVFTAMENTGVFGVLEDLLENIAGPLGQMIGLLVSGLAPVLGMVIRAVMKVSDALLSGLTRAVIQLMPALVPLIAALVKLAVGVLVPLLPPLTQVALALVKILLAVTPLLVPVANLTTLLTILISDALQPVAGFIATVAGWLAKLADSIAGAIGWVARFIGKGIEWVSNFAHVKAAASNVWNWIKGHWPLLASILGGPMAIAAYLISTHWKQISHGASVMFHDVIRFFERIPGEILHALGNVGTMLWNAGAAIVSGLVHGMESKLDSARHEAAHLADNIAGFFGLSPAREGPLSGGGAPGVRGEHFAADIAQGMLRGLPGVRSASGMLAATAGLMARGGLALAGGGRAELVFSFERTGDKLIDDIFDQLKLKVREKGGGGPYSVQKALGRTWPAG